ncbi:hypothetical protein FRC12_019057 [Ceratobasidium sp. 428]|nr:hypothetical protein FRC12_019057 [Ceratobasidium sp. 428]
MLIIQCIQVANGLAYLHESGMVHGDLKSHNVLVSGEGVAKITGFEVAALAEHFSAFGNATKFDGGSSVLKAPELITREGSDPPESTASDVYALGMTILEVITSNVPFYEYKFDPWVTLAVMEGKHPEQPPEFSTSTKFGDRLWSIMLECWNIQPQHRPMAKLIKQKIEDTHQALALNTASL